MPEISVIVPVYNVEAYLRRCVESVLAQTFAGLEVILVDDGSTDNCPIICDEYAGRDSRVTVIHQTNRGLGGARNTGLDNARGDYIAFVDSDDYIAPVMYEILLNDLLANQADICVCGFQKVDENGQPAGSPDSYEHRVLTGLQALELLYTNDYVYFTIACNKLFCSSLFVSYRFPEGKLFEDGYAAYRYYYAAKTVVCMPDCYYFYYKRANSITTSQITVKNLDCFDTAVDAIDFFNANNLDALYKKAQKKYYDTLIYGIRYFDLYKPDIGRKFKEIHRDFRRLYPGLLKYPAFSKKEKMLIALFRINPRLCKTVIKVKKL